MALIRKLDPQTINAIAAGEVIERPASVAKELIDNALDAEASIIRLTYSRGGIKELTCLDNGRGMAREDVLMALESHATSKLRTPHDLHAITSMGFRGEALPSIASVSRLEIRSRRPEDGEGTRILVEGGERVLEGPCGMSPGSQVICRDLFYNTPARYKFLKSDAAEGGALADMVGKMALARPEISFRLERTDDGKEILYSPGDNDLLSAIYVVLGREAAGQMLEVQLEEGPVRIQGYMTGPEGARHNRARQIFMVNGRLITSPILRAAVDEASKTWFMKGRFSQLVLKLDIPPNLLDVNVHPQKTEVRFWDDRAVFRSVFQAIRGSLEGRGREVRPVLPEKDPYPVAKKDKVQLVFETRPKKEDPAGGPYNIPPAKLEGERGEDSPPPLVKKEATGLVQVPDQAEEKDEPARLKEARLIGIFLDTYILLEEGDSLVLVDQHAAHERVLYEELLQKKKEQGARGVPGQTLLSPVLLDFSPDEMALLEEEALYFQSLGFDYEVFGAGTMALRSVPMTRPDSRALLEPGPALRAALDALALARQTGGRVDDGEVLHLMACKAAVKAHDRLSEEEVAILLDRLTGLTNPFHCPHGRPVALRLSKEDIEKRFGRLV